MKIIMAKKARAPRPMTFGPTNIMASTRARTARVDKGELERLDQKKKGMGPALDRALAEPWRGGVQSGTIDCLRCQEPMDEVPHELATWITIDQCPKCDGIFLDAGELGEIRKRPLTSKELAKARVRRSIRSRRAARRREADEGDAAGALANLSTLLLLG